MCVKKMLIPLLALLTLAAGCAARPAGTEAASETEIAVDYPGGRSGAVDLSAPDSPVPGVLYSPGVLRVEAAGTYRLSGVFAGRLIVDADGPVELVLAGASITGPACITVLSDEPVTLTAEEGTVNALSDGAAGPDQNASAAVYSKAPLTIGGEGTLTVTAAANNGVQCKSALTVTGGTLTVTAANHALKSRGALTVTGGVLRLACGGDGLNAQAGRLAGGDVLISGGQVDIRSDSRGIDAEDTFQITGGALIVQSADDSIRAAGIEVSGGDISLSTVVESTEEMAETSDVETPEAETGDGLKARQISLSGGNVTVRAADEALQADSLISIAGGRLQLTSAANGVSCGGDIVITDGVLSLNAGLDGIQAAGTLSISGGTLDIVTGGGGGGASGKSGDNFGPGFSPGGGGWSQTADAPSAKGLKSDGSIFISGGTVVLNTADDSIHCTVLCTIDSGDLTILSSDDAIHSDDMLVINGGNIHITDCFEGLEAFAVEVNGGDIIIRSVNDGINANGPEMMMFGGSGMGRQAASIDSISGETTTYFRQTGGSIDLAVTGTWNNVGDGVDSNGSVFIEGGTLIVSTRGDTQEGGIDKGGGELLITGGMVMAGGASMMQESISESSTQCCAVLATATQPAGTTVAILDSGGREIWSATMANTFNCLVLTHPALQRGNVYTVTYGGQSATLDFTDTTVINMAGGFGGFGGRPF